MLRFSLLLAGASVAFAQQYTISTIAGGAPPATPVAASNTSIGAPRRVAADSAGNVYFSSSNAVFKMSGATLTLVAGNSRAGFSGDGGPAVNAQLNSPEGVAVDSSGNLFIADSRQQPRPQSGSQRHHHHLRRQRQPSASLDPVSYGDGGTATDATLHLPTGLAVDKSGNVYIADTGNNAVRRIGDRRHHPTRRRRQLSQLLPATGAAVPPPNCTAPPMSRWMARASFTSPTQPTRPSARSIRQASSPPLPVTPRSAMPATADRPSAPAWSPPSPSRWTPRAMSTSCRTAIAASARSIPKASSPPSVATAPPGSPAMAALPIRRSSTSPQALPRMARATCISPIRSTCACVKLRAAASAPSPAMASSVPPETADPRAMRRWMRPRASRWMRPATSISRIPPTT